MPFFYKAFKPFCAWSGLLMPSMSQGYEGENWNFSFLSTSVTLALSPSLSESSFGATSPPHLHPG